MSNLKDQGHDAANKNKQQKIFQGKDLIARMKKKKKNLKSREES